MDDLYFDWDGQPISREEWQELYLRPRHVGLDRIGDWEVSTVWIGLDLGFGRSQPLTFETMIFEGHSSSDLYMERYSTLEDAQAGHQLALIALHSHLADLEALTQDSNALEPHDD